MGKPAEKKQKKKGRPSLLDLQKRSLRLQKLQEQKKKRNPNPIPDAITNPYARFPIPSAGRRSSRRNPNLEPKSASPAEDEDDTEAAASMEDDEEDDDEPKERRKEKKLKLVLHLPHPNTNSPDLGSYASESNGTVPEKRNIDTVEKQTEGKNSAWKATEGLQGTSDSGPTTPLPDKKLLDVILDRLQKKDIYGVFSEPVDPEELPDYHDIIKHPMDFGTVRNKLSSGAYKDLEQFEKDVFLISSNAMRYNAPGTIYFRQARSINELAKKGFENLRHEGDGGEREPKIVRRGRPPGTGKNNFKRPVGRPPAERAGSEFSSEASLSNALNGNLYSGLRNDLLRKGSGQDQQRIAADVSVRPTQFIHSSEAYVLGSEHKSVRNEDYSGSTWKGFSNYGKKVSAMDESRRNTYKQSASIHECSVLEALDGERKVLLPVGFHAEYAYARSLARFAAHLGPIGWNIAAKRIEKVLPAGIKFGPGWVGEINAPQSYRPQLSKPSLHSPSMQPNISAASGGDRHSERLEEHPSNNSVGKDRHFGTSLPPSSASISTIPHERFHDSSEAKGSSPFHHNNATTQPLANGFKVPFTPNLPSHPGMFLRPNPARGTFGLEAVIAQARTISTLSSKCSDSSGHELPSTLPRDEARTTEPEINPTPVTNHVNSLPSSSKGPFPVVTVDSKKPDLALQL